MTTPGDLRPSPQDSLAGGGEMGALMRSTDWSRDPVRSGGGVAAEPAHGDQHHARVALRDGGRVGARTFASSTTIATVRFSGPSIPRRSAPAAPRSFPKCGPPSRPRSSGVRRGRPFAIDDWLLPLDRNGYLENCWFTLSYSPIRDESGGVGRPARGRGRDDRPRGKRTPARDAPRARAARRRRHARRSQACVNAAAGLRREHHRRAVRADLSARSRRHGGAARQRCRHPARITRRRRSASS